MVASPCHFLLLREYKKDPEAIDAWRRNHGLVEKEIWAFALLVGNDCAKCGATGGPHHNLIIFVRI